MTLNEVVVVDYDPEWPEQFEAICKSIRPALSAVTVLAIEHVGSTSVPGLAAKPYIDVDVVALADQVTKAIQALESIGYGYRGDLGIRDRHALSAPAGAIRQNMYVVVAGCLALRNHLGVRDVLRTDAELRRKYGALKHNLANQTKDIDLYIEAKSALLQDILRQAGLSAAELAEIEQINRR